MFPKTNFDSSSDKKPTKVIVQFRHLEGDANFKRCHFEGRNACIERLSRQNVPKVKGCGIFKHVFCLNSI